MNVHLTSLIWRGIETYIFVYVYLTCTVQDVRTVHYLGLYVSMDSIILTLASFSQRYLAKAQDDINVKIVT